MFLKAFNACDKTPENGTVGTNLSLPGKNILCFNQTVSII